MSQGEVMDGRLTAEDLATLVELEKAATPGPWVASRPEQKGEDWPHGIIVAATARGLGIYASGDTATFPSADRDLIAAVRNALPALLASAAAAQVARQQSIDAAPRDGSDVLLFFARRRCATGWWDGEQWLGSDSDEPLGEPVGWISLAAIEKATKP
jgi:hypothetical protein